MIKWFKFEFRGMFTMWMDEDLHMAGWVGWRKDT